MVFKTIEIFYHFFLEFLTLENGSAPPPENMVKLRLEVTWSVMA